MCVCIAYCYVRLSYTGVFFGVIADGGGGDDRINNNKGKIYTRRERERQKENDRCLLKLAYARNAIIYQKRFHFITRE